jgi:hypothetical protein
MKVEIGRWKLECDPDETRRLYTETAGGAALTCGCPGCVNFDKVRDANFPVALRALLEPLGIDIDKVISVRRVAPLDSGTSLYAGSFALAGKIVEGDEDLRMECSLADVYERVDEKTNIALRVWKTPPAPWNEVACVRIRFLMVLPWEGEDPFAPLDLSSCRGPADRPDDEDFDK